ncbi:MAG: HlyU family transcriptional regulator [Aeromonadaceae bacterium]
MLASWFKKIFFADSAKPTTPQAEAIEHEGFLLYPEPQPEGGQYRVAGRICKEVDGELKTHLFIRSDLLSNKQDAEQLMVSKAVVYIRQMNGDIFR